MANVSHLWNVTKFLMKMKMPQANELRNHYIQCCRELSNEVELPKQIFGPGSMCCNCGSLWNAIEYKVRIEKGKSLSTSMKKLLRNENKKTLSVYQQKLIRKCVKNQSNKLIITCSCCHNNTVIILNKPPRLFNITKQKIEQQCSDGTTGITPRRKKKRNRDKNAGLLINTPITPILNSFAEKNTFNHNNNTPTSRSKKEKLKKINTPILGCKSKKINLSKLKGIVDTTVTPSKKSSLHSFLTELG
ncbi:hypothetical protein PV327_000134 [Microctonus hyperodae]|uniref:Uncharacterized protein n=1 Tax=Microctonus hyperodae TaxID=165561 RepID=A0AA39G5L8_MICHY|nr:hypothetical protein PV327_000134 [Microctonus hyperodae]